MKIALLDLNHFTRGIHTNTVPLGLGLIAAYLKKTVNYPFEIKIFKDTEKSLKVFNAWLPDVLGLAQYSWNSELNLHIAKLVKELKPSCLIIAGGPNLELSASRKADYLKKHPCIDICVSYDGEIPFAEVIKQLISGMSIDQIKKNPVAGTYSIDTYSGTLNESSELPPRQTTLDCFGAVYADGIFDELLDDGFHPFVQTHRGCPFKCTFCHTSAPYYSKMLYQSPEIFAQDMEYLGKRFSGMHNVTLYMANTNMGLFKQDFPIAHVIREIQAKYDWPKLINVNSGKDPKKLLEMISIVKFNPAIALQTLTASVLDNIKRKNIPFKDFVAFQHEAMLRTGETSETELILCLPGETKASFMETLCTVMNSGVQNIVVYTLMNLKGTALSSDEEITKYGYTIRHRVVPRQFSVINDAKVLDTEEVIVGTDLMPYEDYLELRGISFSITSFFAATELIPLKRLLIEYKVDIADWILGIHGRLSEFQDIYDNYKAFLKETEEELFNTRSELLDFFEDQGNFEALCSGRFGDNLLRKYKGELLYKCYATYLALAISEARRLLRELIELEKADTLLDDMSTFLSTRNMKQIFENESTNAERNISLTYDIPRWLEDSDNRQELEHFKGARRYAVGLPPETKERRKDISDMNKDFELSLQILYRDGSIRDFWPSWEPINNA